MEHEKPVRALVTQARLIAAICLIVPMVAVLAVPVYNKRTPEVGGVPFYFWWQLLWVVIAAFLMGIAYFVVRREELAHKTVSAGAIPDQPSASNIDTEAAR